MAKRSFEQMSVSVTIAGVQSGIDRMGKRQRHDEKTPTIAQWRCNLVRTTSVRRTRRFCKCIIPNKHACCLLSRCRV